MGGTHIHRSVYIPQILFLPNFGNKSFIKITRQKGKKMKKTIMSVSILAVIFTLTSALYASYNMDVDYVLYMQKARGQYDTIHKKLTDTVNLINKEGTKAFDKIKENDTFGVFVIDPRTGKILVSPSEKTIGKDALKNSEINGKAIAQEAIKEARARLYGTDSWTDMVGDMYKHYFTNLAVTLNGKLYVVAIGKTNKNLQRLFVTKIVDNACKVLETTNTKEAYKIFNKKNGIFRFKDTYIFVYQIKSDKEIICLYNPNYPEDVGKNLINLKVHSGYVIKNILAQLKKSDRGWIRSEAAVPGTKKVLAKDIYVKAVNINGKKLAVGSGVYLAD